MSELRSDPALSERMASERLNFLRGSAKISDAKRRGLFSTLSLEAAALAQPIKGVRSFLRSRRQTPANRSNWAKDYVWKLRLTDAGLTSAALTAAFVLSIETHLPLGSSVTPDSGYVGYCLVALVLWNADLEFCRSRERRLIGSGVAEYRRITQSTLRTFGVLAMLMVAFGAVVPRLFFAAVLPLGLGVLLLGRWHWRRWLGRQRRQGRFLSTVVVVGSCAESSYVVEQLGRNLCVGYTVGGVALTTLNPELREVQPWNTMPVLEKVADIDQIVASCGAEVVVVAGELPGGPSTIQELGWRLGDLDLELVLASSLTNVAGPRVHLRPVEGLPLMHVEMPHYSGGRHVVKRGMDILLSSFGLLVLSPLLVLLALIVRVDSSGPALFHQRRVGKNGQAFNLLKFRSMNDGAEAQQAALHDENEGAGLLFKMAIDPRVTRCGRWMRKYSLDELPQLWNVLLGHMSLVGPRPPLAQEVAQYESPTQRRLLIKPGITGLWQINGRSDLPWEEAVRLDLYYVENWSLTGDLVILWRTVKVVVAAVGAY